MKEEGYVLPEWAAEAHLFYMMQQSSMLRLSCAFKVPVLPPWRRKKRKKKPKTDNLQALWPRPAHVRMDNKIDVTKVMQILDKQLGGGREEIPRPHNDCEKKVFKFTIGKTQKLLVYLLKTLNCRLISELKYKEINDDQWKKITKKVKVPCSYIKKYWYYKLHMQLFCPEPIKMKNVVIKLIRLLYENKGRPINWAEVRPTRFDGYTTEFLSIICDFLLRFAKRNVDSTRPDDVIDYLYYYHIPAIEKAKNTWMLPRLDPILRRIDPVPALLDEKCQLLDTCHVIRSYLEPFKQSMLRI